MPALITLTILSYSLLICIFVFSQSLQANTATPLTPEEFNNYHQCDKSFEYDVYLLGSKVGYLHRKIKWGHRTDVINATVTSYSEIVFLWLKSTYQQKSTMEYAPQYQYFLTPHFTQKMTGIKTRAMSANMSHDGISSTVTLNNKVFHYQNSQKSSHKNFSENLSLYDIDTLGTQMRLNLLRGETKFTLFRQASSKIEGYQFEVAGREVINHETWGPLTAIKVIEVGEHTATILWFSPNHDHQLIKAKLDMIFSPTVWLSAFNKEC